MFPDCNLTTFSSGQRAFFFRIAVANNGNVDENNVQLYHNSVKRKSLDDFFSTCNNILLMSLSWLYQDNELKKSSIAQIISPGMTKHCDFPYIIENTNNCFSVRRFPYFLTDFQLIGLIKEFSSRVFQ